MAGFCGANPTGLPLGAGWLTAATLEPLEPRGYLPGAMRLSWLEQVANGTLGPDPDMGELERGHLYALLGSGLDIGYLADPGRPQRVITTQGITIEPDLVDLLDDMATRLLVLSSPDSAAREEANQRVGQAINFITTTPFIFAQEGR